MKQRDYSPSIADKLLGGFVCEGEMVGARGFEPPTLRSRTVRATKLRHAPSCPVREFHLHRSTVESDRKRKC